MRRRLLTLALTLLAVCVQAQVMSWEDFVETYAVGGEDTGNATDWQTLHENPVNLNDCRRDDLLQIPFLSEAQVDSVLGYVQRHGPLLSVEELQFVQGMDAFSRNVARQFVYCGPEAREASRDLWHRLRYGKNEVAVNMEWPF